MLSRCPCEEAGIQGTDQVHWSFARIAADLWSSRWQLGSVAGPVVPEPGLVQVRDGTRRCRWRRVMG